MTEAQPYFGHFSHLWRKCLINLIDQLIYAFMMTLCSVIKGFISALGKQPADMPADKFACLILNCMWTPCTCVCCSVNWSVSFKEGKSRLIFNFRGQSLTQIFWPHSGNTKKRLDAETFLLHHIHFFCIWCNGLQYDIGYIERHNMLLLCCCCNVSL